MAALADDHRFGSSPPLSLGVEEELLLVDERLQLVAVAEQTIARLAPAARESVSTELFANQIELKTGICEDADGALAELEAARRVERILREGNGADRQRRLYGEGGMELLLGALAERTEG